MSAMRKGFDYIGVTVGLYGVFNNRGQVLMIKRGRDVRDEHGTWDCVGGGMKFGETFEEAARREMKEELNCDITDLKLCGINNVLRTHKGEPTHWVCLIFKGKINPKQIRNNEPNKIDDIRWFDVDKLPTPLHSMYLKHFVFIRKSLHEKKP